MISGNKLHILCQYTILGKLKFFFTFAVVCSCGCHKNNRLQFLLTDHKRRIRIKRSTHFVAATNATDATQNRHSHILTI